MNLKNRLNITDNEISVAMSILSGSINSVDESVRNMNVDDEEKKSSKVPDVKPVPDTPLRIANKVKKDVDDLEIEEMVKKTSTVLENIRSKLSKMKFESTEYDLVSGEDAKKVPTQSKKPEKKLFQKDGKIESNIKSDFDLVPEEVIHEAEASSTHTGKIKSSKRIITSLELAAEQDKEVSFQFENGTTATIQPALAKMAIRNYNTMSEYEKAEAAKKMRLSFKDFLSFTKSHS